MKHKYSSFDKLFDIDSKQFCYNVIYCFHFLLSSIILTDHYDKLPNYLKKTYLVRDSLNFIPPKNVEYYESNPVCFLFMSRLFSIAILVTD